MRIDRRLRAREPKGERPSTAVQARERARGLTDRQLAKESAEVRGNTWEAFGQWCAAVDEQQGRRVEKNSDKPDLSSSGGIRICRA